VLSPHSLEVAGQRFAIEREMRFVPAGNLPLAQVSRPTWHGHAVSLLRPEMHHTTYFDTPTHALARQGITFRRRLVWHSQAEGSDPVAAEITLKLPRIASPRHLFTRPEYTDHAAPEADLTTSPLAALAAEYAPDERISAWFTSCTTRTGCELQRNEATITMTWDRLTLPDDPTYVDEEIEAELLAGSIDVLDDLAVLMTSQYGLTFGDRGKRTRAGRHLARLGLISFPS
jgi:inorganic triphosphatase YgiF